MSSSLNVQLMRIKLLVLCLVISKMATAQGPSDAATVNNGIEYVTPITGNVFENKHPFYQSDHFSEGEITYFGRHYTHILLKYDLSLDRVITLYADGRTEIILYPEQIDSFTVYDQTFVKLPDSLGLPKGFYARIVTTPDYTYYVRYTKSISHQVYVDGAFYDVVHDHHYDYIKVDNAFHSFKSLKDLSELLNANKKQTKIFQRNNPLGSDDALASTARYREYCMNVARF